MEPGLPTWIPFIPVEAPVTHSSPIMLFAMMWHSHRGLARPRVLCELSALKSELKKPLFSIKYPTSGILF